MPFGVYLRRLCSALALLLLFAGIGRGDDPKPTAQNTIHVALGAPVQPQKFASACKFTIDDVTDRSGNAQPMLVFKPRGGVFLDRQPSEIVREAVSGSLKAAGLLADEGSSDLVMHLYIFHFGLANDSAFDFFGKVELAVLVKNPKTGASMQVPASGTSIANHALLKKNLQHNVEVNVNEALQDAIRNLLRGTQLRDAVATLLKPAVSAPAQAGTP